MNIKQAMGRPRIRQGENLKCENKEQECSDNLKEKKIIEDKERNFDSIPRGNQI